MYRVLVLCTLVLAVISLAHAQEVFTLGEGNFSSFVTGSPTTLVMFYAPWCGHSKSFMPSLDILAKGLSEIDVQVAKVDCLAEKELYWSNGIEGFPTLKLFFSDTTYEPVQFKAERNVANVLQFVKKELGSTFLSSDLTLQHYEEFSTEHLSAVHPLLLVFQPSTGSQRDSDRSKTITSLVDFACKRLDVLRCAVSSDASLLSSLTGDVDTADILEPVVLMIRDFVGEPVVVRAPSERLFSPSALTSSTHIVAWTQQTAFPLLVEFTPANEPLMFTDSRPGYKNHVVLVVDSTSPDFPSVASAARQLAVDPAFLGKCILVYIDTSSTTDATSAILNDIQVSRAEAPTALFILSLKTQVKFHRLGAGQPVDVDSLRRWMSAVLAGEVAASRTVDMAAQH